MNNPAGSTWRKWDLHVHTPASLVQHYGGETDAVWASFIDDLEKLPPEFKVIGINDYIFVDGYERVLNEKQAGRLKNIDLILPVVELRLDKFGGVVKKNEDGTYSSSEWSKVNLHIIFDQLSPDVIRQQFLTALVQCFDLIPEAIQFKGKWQAVITRDSLIQLGQMVIDSVPAEHRAARGGPLQEGFNNFCVSLEKIQKALESHDLRGRHLIAVGKAEWEGMKWNDQSIADKRNIINCVDLVFTASENPEAYAKAKARLEENGVKSTLLDCSDAHALSTSSNKDRIGQCFTWIKADPTFAGLVQAVAEFEQRVFIGDTPPKRLLVDANRTKYASSIAITKRAGSTLSETWFNIDVPLNHDLVAIIGNKGSGKSALSDTIALAGDTKNHASFSFLRENRFRNPRSKLAEHFIGTLRWHDGTESQRSLHENPATSSVERVKYLPQSYLETLCNELADNSSSTFDGELRKIIYTHVPEEQQIGFPSLDDLLNFKISQLEEERKLLLDELSKLNQDLISVENRLSAEFRSTLTQQLDARKGELTALQGSQPAAVEDPQESEAAKLAAAAANEKLAQLETELKTVLAEEQGARQKKADALKSAAHTTRILQAIRTHQKSHDQFMATLNEMLAEVPTNLRAADVITLTLDPAKLTQLDAGFRKEAEAQDSILTDEGGTGLMKRREAAESAIKALKSQLGEKQRLYLVYREQLVQWERAKAEIQGDKDKANSIAWYEAQLDVLETLPDKRQELKSKRLDLVRQIHAQIEKAVAEYRTLYQPVQGFVQSATKMEMPLPLDFNVRIVDEGFQDAFLNRINRQARGSFAGIDESADLIRRILSETEFMEVESVVAFVDKIDDMLHFDRRNDTADQTEIPVTNQLRKGHRLDELYDFVFSLEYLKPRYSLTYDKQEIGQLSPGERGLLLLVFYLLVDKDDIPLVIDQPEENLDNQTIFKVLVRCIKAAKQRRQIIMVTHNPNLAVVCDAEQIIYADCDKTARQFAYTSGAIESPEIRDQVVEILEGTQPAFVNRQRKYGF